MPNSPPSALAFSARPPLPRVSRSGSAAWPKNIRSPTCMPPIKPCWPIQPWRRSTSSCPTASTPNGRSGPCGPSSKLSGANGRFRPGPPMAWPTCESSTPSRLKQVCWPEGWRDRVGFGLLSLVNTVVLFATTNCYTIASCSAT